MAGELEHIRPTHPSQPYPAARTRNIIWCDAAGNAHSIKAVYWSPSNNANDLKLIWLRDHTQKTLINDDTTGQYLMIKYTPAADIQVSSIGILTDPNGSGNGANFIILNDGGLLIYTSYNQSHEATNNTEIYSYTGIKRTRTINTPVTLYKGKTYWIHYHFSNCRNHRGAYFQNTNGSYKNMGTVDLVTFAGYPAYPEYANNPLTGRNIQAQVSTNDNYLYVVEYILSNKVTQNDKIVVSSDNNNTYLRTDLALNLTYDRRLKGSTDNFFGITHEHLATITIGNLFIINGRHYDGDYIICKCTSHDTSKSVTDCYELISDYYVNNTQYSKVANYPLFNRINNQSFIQYLDNGAAANYWNANPETSKMFYLEINGTEKSNSSERL